ncbi:YdbH domain-containing protein [Allopontixanthobacter confluentis]|nr:YdbH domain-containing protein [Allopontixanthobacter confluentis]
MAQAEENNTVMDDTVPDSARRKGVVSSVGSGARRRVAGRVLLAVVALLFGAALTIWQSREIIADNILADQLERLGVAATYDIEEIAPDRQVISNLVIGDPAKPDLTIERVEISLRYRFGTPAIGRVTAVKPRLYGTYRNGTLSFGALDPLLFGETDQPAGLPDLDLALVDARGLVLTDFGPIGLKAEGKGRLNDGFSGILAAVAPDFKAGDCAASNASLYGAITTQSGKPRFSGPVRVGRLTCSDSRISLRNAALKLDAKSDAEFSRFEGRGQLATGAASAAGNRTAGLNGTLRAKWANDSLDGTFAIAAGAVDTSQLGAAVMTAKGSLRGRGMFDQVEVDAQVEGNGVRLGDTFDRALADMAITADGSFAAPLVQKMRESLRREARGSQLAADIRVRKTGAVMSANIPQATLRGGSGATLLSLSRVQWGATDGGRPRLSGNIATGGAGLPEIIGRMERSGNGQSIFRLRMAQYAAGESRLAIPQLVVSQARSGAIGFAGQAVASGAMPGGSARNLQVPLSGNWSPSGGLSLWRQCTLIRFDRLAVANLTFDRRALTLCPAGGQAIVRSGPAGLRIAAGAPTLDLAGTLAGTPIRIASGPVGFAYPGALTARNLDITLGRDDSANRFVISNLDARIGKDIAGSFSDADVRLYAVPLDLGNTSGNWNYSGGVLTITDASFTLRDRSADQRFEIMQARGASLTLKDSIINADAVLREPRSDREVTRVDIVHSLASGTGHANLAVDGLLFDDRLQPEDLSMLALGVIANAKGVVTGTGRIDWNSQGVTSTGVFSSDSLDFAAAFGPVRGASGTVRFTDLLGLTTAPDQRIKVASLNPGIEVNDGEISISLQGGQMLSVAGGTWPFMGGTLALKPVNLKLGTAESRAYVLEITGLDAAQFIAQMELGNLSATGVFDGIIPIIFDEAGNGRIEGGRLDSRPPGGNLAYVGELTYRDLTPIANFAFGALRSLDFDDMQIAMDGSLSGEIVTRVRFDGVSQGAGTKNNFITRQIANLPVQFRVNIRAPFYQLITSVKAMYDPAFVKDPRDLGLVSANGTRLKQQTTAPPPQITPSDLIPDGPSAKPVSSVQNP